jgi:hypothetical protein
MLARMSMVSQATIEAMQMGAVANGMTGGANPAMLVDPAAQGGPGAGMGNAMSPNAAPYLSPSQFGGSTGQQSPGRPQNMNGGGMPGMGGM